MSLARLWRDQGKLQQAREQLAPVYRWFTEGFETRDLKEAKVLMEELGLGQFLALLLTVGSFKTGEDITCQRICRSSSTTQRVGKA